MSEKANEPWRQAWSGEERRHRRPDQERAALRRLTVWTIVAAAALNIVLFVQTGVQQLGPADFQNALAAAIGGLFPGTGLHAASASPAPAPSGSAVATSGGS